MEKYLKKTDGEVYGPVSADDMTYWATEGRISPEDQISDDGESWQPAPSFAELGMEWMVTMPDGEPYGPIHLQATSELVRDAIVAPSTTITHKDSGETQVLSEALVGAMIERTEGLRNSVQTLRAHLDEFREREKAMAKTSDQAAAAAAAQEELNRKLEEIRSRNKTLIEEAKDWETRFLKERKDAEQAKSDHQATAQKLEAEIGRLREKGEEGARNLASATTQIEGLREELKEASRAVVPTPAAAGEDVAALQQALEKAKAEHKEERATLRQRIKDLEQKAGKSADAPESYRVLATAADNLQRDVDKWKKLYDDEREGARTREDTLKERIEELRANEASALSRLDEVDRRLRHTQRNYEMMAKAGKDAEGGPEEVLNLQMSVLMDSHNELSQSYDTLFSQLQTNTGQLDNMMSERQEIESRAEERIKDMEATLKREQEEADQARRQLAEMQQSHFQLVKSYREMNDRFIRIRQELEQAPTPAAPPQKASPKASEKGSRIRLNR